RARVAYAQAIERVEQLQQLISVVVEQALASVSVANAPTELYTLSLHDALPIFADLFALDEVELRLERGQQLLGHGASGQRQAHRSEEHTSELQSQSNLVCRLLLEKKNEAVAHPRNTLT